MNIFITILVLSVFISVSYSSSLSNATGEEDGIGIKTRITVKSNKAWPKGVIYYYNNFKSNASMTKTIKDAMKEIESKTCVKWKEVFRENQVKNYVYITSVPGKGCYGDIGMEGGRQLLSLEKGVCDVLNKEQGRKIVAMHELLHSVGLVHMHQRPDRDKYISIHWENVDPSQTVNFKVIPSERDVDVGGPFDFDSVMMYGSKAFNSNSGKLTITKKNGAQIPEHYDKPGMSKGDIKEVKRLYRC